jgi:hypothetical protein
MEARGDEHDRKEWRQFIGFSKLALKVLRRHDETKEHLSVSESYAGYMEVSYDGTHFSVGHINMVTILDISVDNQM